MLGEFPSLSETFVLNQITALIDRGHDVSIFAERQSNEATTHADVARYDLRRRTRYEAMPRSFWGRLRVLASPWRLRRAERRALNVFRFGRDALSLRLLWAARMVGSDANFDIIQCHFGALGRKAALLRQAGALRGCIVTAFHGEDIISYPKRLGSDVYQPLFAEGDLFLPISDRWHDSLHSLGCPMERVRVHRMGVDTSEFSPRGPTSDAEAPIQILSVSRLVEKKGIGDAILAVARLRIGYTYQIVGDGPLRSVLDALAKFVLASSAITLLGPQPQSTVASLLQVTDVFLAPSVTASDGDIEGLPVAIMEAMASGVPVVSTWHSGIPELVADGVSGFLVPEGDVDALADRLTRLAEAPALRAAMGAAGRAIVVGEFDSTMLASRLEGLYAELLASTRPAVGVAPHPLGGA